VYRAKLVALRAPVRLAPRAAAARPPDRLLSTAGC